MTSHQFKSFFSNVEEQLEKIEEDVYGDALIRSERDLIRAEDEFFESVSRTRNPRSSVGYKQKSLNDEFQVVWSTPDSVCRRLGNWGIPIVGSCMLVLFCTSMFFSGRGNWYYAILTLLLEPASCLCTILPWMNVHPVDKHSQGSTAKKSGCTDERPAENISQDFAAKRTEIADERPVQKHSKASKSKRSGNLGDHLAGFSASTGLYPRTATCIIFILTLLKVIAVHSQPKDLHYFLLQPGESQLALPARCKGLSLLYVVANQLILYMYIPWLHRDKTRQNNMSIVAFLMPVALIISSGIDIFNLEPKAIEVIDSILWGFIGVSWLGILLFDCKNDALSMDVAYLSSLLWINQVLPIAAGRIMISIIREWACHSGKFIYICVLYWGFSAIFLQFMKRAAHCATNWNIAEAFVFQLQHTFDVFFALIYLNTNFPSALFWILLLWNFCQVIVRDGDFIGIILERIRELYKIVGDPLQVGMAMRRSWRLLTIQNSLSERIAWLEATVSVAFEAFAWGLAAQLNLTSNSQTLDVITNGLTHQRDKYMALCGYLIFGVILVLSQAIASHIWDHRLYNTSYSRRKKMIAKQEKNLGGVEKENRLDNCTVNKLHQTEETDGMELGTVEVVKQGSKKYTQVQEPQPVIGTDAQHGRRNTPMLSFVERELNPHNFHREYMKKHANYFRVVILYVMCTAYYSLAKINVEVRQKKC